MGTVFAISFFVVLIVYAYLAAFTTVLYRGKSIADLSGIQRDILFGRATKGARTREFLFSMFTGLMFPPCWIIAGIAVGIYWLITTLTH